MLSFLFPRLTPDAPRGSALFDALVAEARQAHWFLEGQVPDTIDGRFAVLSTIVALATVRFERGGEATAAPSAALAERFIEAMDAEHRQMGIGDPTLGKTVRKLVGALSRRVELWRAAIGPDQDWNDAVSSSVFGDAAPSDEALERCEHELRACWARLQASSEEALAEGRIG